MISNDILLPLSSSILIVDDNPQNLQVLGKVLKDNKYEIEFATNGDAALGWLNIRQFDLILLDINMPGMNGFEVCRKIRLNPVLNNVPVIFLSAESERESILKGFELGAQDYITKPFDSRELLVRVRTHLVLKDSLEKLAELNKSLEEKVIERTQQLKEANEKLEALNFRLIDLDKAKSDFLNLISHEIRTPLNGIIGPLELLKGTVYTSEIGELVQILDMSVKRLEKFSLDALLITRLKTKQLEIRKEEINLSGLINKVIDESKEKLQLENIRVKRNDEITQGLITGEVDLIKKCIGNIFDNAVLFSPKDSVIEINTYTKDQTIIYEIKDNGKGFPKGVIDHVFELFATGDACKDNCSGIGLPIAKMIMEAHGGSITVDNNRGGGASVKLLFRKSIVT
jgi:two-component system sensor histidine kinase/response regulator